MKQIVIILILGLFCFGCSNQNLSNDLQFDSPKWKEGDKRTKGRMASDLGKSEVLNDKTKNDIREILGEPDFFGETVWIYEINIGEILNHQFNVFFDKQSGKSTLKYIAN